MYFDLFKKSLFLFSSALIPVCYADWTLGKKDGSSADFLISNYQWEYASYPFLKQNPNFDPVSGIYTIKVDKNGAMKVNAPRYAGSKYYRFWMPEDEVVTGLQLIWNEPADGERTLEVSLCEYKDRNGLPDDFRASLPDGQIVYFQIPKTEGRTVAKKELVWEASFKVKSGENRLLLEDVMNSRENYVVFDSITLVKSENSTQNPPVIELSTSKFGNLFHPGEELVINADLYNQLPDGLFSFTVKDWNGKTVHHGKQTLNSGANAIKILDQSFGYFRFEGVLQDKSGKVLALGNADNKTVLDYAFIATPDTASYPDSPYGFHGADLNSKLRLYRRGGEEINRFAMLAGFRWARLSLKYGMLQPEQDIQPKWEIFDKYVSMYEKYGMHVHLVIAHTPKWAATTEDGNWKNPIGQPVWAYTVPKLDLWKECVRKSVEHYKGRIKYWEIWNEPDFQSCFWFSGSPKDYADLLKVSYDAVKAADPDAQVVTGGFVNAFRFVAEMLTYLDGKRYYDFHGFHYSKNPPGYSYASWRSVLKDQFAAPFMNTEEAIRDGNAWPDDRRQAELLVKKLVREQANGVVRTFLFDPLSEGMDDERSLLHTNMSPRPAFVAMRTLTHHLEGYKFIGALPVDVGGEAYLFAKGNTPVLVAWANSGKLSFNVPARGNLKVYDLMNVSRTVQDGLVELDSLPVFIEGGDMEMLSLMARVVVKASPEFPHVVIGKSEKVILQFQNNSRERSTVKINIENKSALKISSAANELVLGPGKLSDLKLIIEAPSAMARAVCPVSVQMDYKSVSGKRWTSSLNLKINPLLVPPGMNLLSGGDFKTEDESIKFWSLMKGTEWIPKGGLDDASALRSKTTDDLSAASFSYKQHIQVLPGESYVLAGWARSALEGIEASSIVQYSLFDASGKLIYPLKPGGNLMGIKVSNDWRLYYDTINVSESDARSMSLYFCNLHKKKGEILWDDIRLVQLGGKVNEFKALWQSECRKTGKTPFVDGLLNDWDFSSPMRIYKDGKVLAEGALTYDSSSLYLAFKVNDDIFFQKKEGLGVYEGDAIEFAIDPDMDGKDYNEYSVALTEKGVQVYRRHCVLTQELMKSMYLGIVNEAEAVVVHKDGVISYEIKLPLESVYPLSLQSGAPFGFSWVVDDNDGAGRSFYEWSSGIANSKKPSEYGMIRVLE